MALRKTELNGFAKRYFTRGNGLSSEAMELLKYYNVTVDDTCCTALIPQSKHLSVRLLIYLIISANVKIRNNLKQITVTCLSRAEFN